MEKFGQEVHAPSELQPATINWANLAKQAMDLEPSESTMEQPPPSDPGIPTPAQVAAKVEVKTEAEPAPEVVVKTEGEPEPTPEVREFKDDDLVRVKVDGKEEVVSYKDYKDGIQRERVFTQRMQQLANQREQAEQELASKYAQLYQYAQSVEMAKQQLDANNPLAKLAQQLEAQGRVEQDPNTLATIGEIQKALKEQREHLEVELTQREQAQQVRLAQAAQQLRQQQVVAQDAARFTSALNETLSQKDIAVIRNAVPSPELADAIIRYNVAQMGPETIEEGIGYMKTFAKQWADQIKAQSKTEDGRAAAAKARATIEPPQGSPPAPGQSQTPQNFFKKDGGLDWGALHAKALSVLET
jgi:hypothetical protein